MADNSKVELLASLSEKAVTMEWGAVAVYGREQLNRLLAQQYLTGFTQYNFLPAINAEFPIAEDGTEVVTLEELILGEPVLSFESASLSNGDVTLTMKFVAGTYTVIKYPQTSVPSLGQTFTLTEEMGFFVKMRISLNQVVGEVDNQGKVTLDIAKARDVTCNLSHLPATQKYIAAYLEEYLSLQPESRRTFELGSFDFSGYDPLCPMGFYLTTQAAPGAKVIGAPNYGDGALLIFIRLKANDRNGTGIPIGNSGFPYLIPSDSLNGKPAYSAALVLANDMRRFVDNTQLDVLKNILFPGQNAFTHSADDQYEPFDLVIFGNIGAAPDSVLIEPKTISLRSGAKQKFTARRGDGIQLADIEWSANSIETVESAGTIDSSGAYIAALPEHMHKNVLPILITAQSRNNSEHVATAMVKTVFESMTIHPRVVTLGVSTKPTVLKLAATSLDGGPISWTLLPPASGSIDFAADGSATYTPPAAQVGSVAIQSIQACDEKSGATIIASVVLVGEVQHFQITPAFVPEVTLSNSVGFSTEPAQLSAWAVIGEGTITQDGIYTPPEVITTPIAVITYTQSIPDMNFERYGFSVVQLTEHRAPPLHWQALSSFIIRAEDGNGCYANGLQQIPLTIEIKTKALRVNEQDIEIPLNDLELSTLKLIDSEGKDLPFISAQQEGLAPGSSTMWAVNEKQNRFTPYPRTRNDSLDTATETTEKPVIKKVAGKANNLTRQKKLWVHLGPNATRTETFKAFFQAQNGQPFYSTDLLEAQGEVKLYGVTSPVIKVEEYTFEPIRISDDGGSTELLPPGQIGGVGNPPHQLDFDYTLTSLDKWRLAYLPNRALTSFVSMKIAANSSTIQWESNALDETFCSYTGYAFFPDTRESVVPKKITFDVYLNMLMRELKHALPNALDTAAPNRGELVLTLHRVPDLPFVYDNQPGITLPYRKFLDPSISLELIDSVGNRHRLTIRFADPANTDSRNKLMLTLN